MEKKEKSTSREGYANATQTLISICTVLMKYSSKDNPLTVQEIIDHIRAMDLMAAAPSVQTVRRILQERPEPLNTLFPHQIFMREDDPAILQSYFKDGKVHVVVENRLGKELRNGRFSLVVEPSVNTLPSASTVDKTLQNFPVQGDGSLFPFRLKCVKKETTRYGVKYIPYTDWEHDLEASGKDPARNNQPRRYYFESILSGSEWRMIYDLIQVYPYISREQTDAFLDALARLAPGAANIISSRYAFKKGSEKQFEHIEAIDQAITQRREVVVKYGEYRLENVNGDWRPVLKQRSHSGELRVQPYALMWSNGYYYLVGPDCGQDRMLNLRVDRILSVSLQNETFRRDPGFDPYEYRDKSPVMYPGKAVPIRFRCDESLINSVQDFFGGMAYYSEPADGKTTVSLTIAPSGFKLFALQYIDRLEVLEPASVREDIIQSLENGLRKHQR